MALPIVYTGAPERALGWFVLNLGFVVEDKPKTQTHTQREKCEKLQEKRKALMEARLAKVRERKLKQKPEEGNPAGSTNTHDIADFNFDKGQQSSSAEKPKQDRNEGTCNLDAMSCLFVQ